MSHRRSRRAAKPRSFWLRSIGWLIPHAERQEVLEDLERELQQRKADGRPAHRWLVAQCIRSIPSFLFRSIWRASSGFEPPSSRFQSGGPWFESLWVDARFALRHLRKRPLYAGLWIGAMALGVGGTVSIGVILWGLLRAPLPYQQPDQLVEFWSTFDWSEAEHVALRDNYPGFSQVTAYRQEPVALQLGDSPAQLLGGIAASSELFEVLGKAPIRGRGFQPGEDSANAAPLAILSHGLWQQLNGTDAVFDRPLELDGQKVEVVGVMPPDFWFPDRGTDVWLNARLDPANRSGNYTMVGRLEQPLSFEGPADAATRVAQLLSERFEYPAEWDKTKNPSVRPLREALLGSARETVLATQFAMLALLLAALANASALLAAQISSRRDDSLLRHALGASWRRVGSQFAVEAVILGIAAGFFASFVAVTSFRFLLDSMPLGALAGILQSGDVTRQATGTAKIAAAAFALGLLLTPMTCLVPLANLVRSRAERPSSGRGVAAGRSRLEGGLVVIEIALAVALVAAVGLFARSAATLGQLETGLDIDRVGMIATTAPSGQGGADRLQRIERLRAQLASVPGVRSAAAVQRPPISGGGWSTNFSVENEESIEGATTYFRMVTPGYFETMGLALIDGRTFADGDRMTGEPLTIINQHLSTRFFPDRSPLGLRIAHGMGPGWARVVGVVENEAVVDLATEPVATRYMLFDHVGFTPQEIAYFTRAEPDVDPTTLIAPARRVIESSSPELAVVDALTLRDLHTRALGSLPQLTRVLLLLGLLALFLGMIGIYGTIGHYVGARQDEWSLRIALGQQPSSVILRVLNRSAILVGAGLTLGLVGVQLGTRPVSSLLFRVEASDPLILLMAAASLAVAGLAAALGPAWRAGSNDPAKLLRP